MSKIKTLLAGAILFVTAICAAPSLSAQCASGGYSYGSYGAPSSYGYGYNAPYSGYQYGYNYPSYGYNQSYGYTYNAPGTSYQNPIPQNPTYPYQSKRYQTQYQQNTQYSQQPMAPQSNR